MAKTTKTAHELLESAEFKALVSKRWSVSIILLILLFIEYYGFILLIAGNKEFVGQKMSGGIVPIGIPMGVAAIVIAWVLTVLYVSWANKSYDPEVARLKDQLK